MAETRNMTKKRKLSETRYVSTNLVQPGFTPLTVNSMPNHMRCRCGGGQSCIIDRRWVGDWVHEDDVFRRKGLPLRKSCLQPYSTLQREALNKELNHSDESNQRSIIDRWNDDSNAERL